MNKEKRAEYTRKRREKWLKIKHILKYKIKFPQKHFAKIKPVKKKSILNKIKDYIRHFFKKVYSQFNNL